MDIRKKFGARLRKLRETQGWSQEELADRAGLHRTYISSVERGVRNPTISVLAKISAALGASLAELLADV
tara:strand:- start:405 stop:614 length:210 start_codon:yes stop_codon:yes gene_type:complete